MTGTLYVVATPIGNLQDLTLRAVEVLKQSDLIACEDTRRTRQLLSHCGIARPMTSYHEFNEAERAENLGNKLAGGLRIALVSDAGTPGLSDPGYRLVRFCRERGLPVVPVPGPSAAIAALSVSGLPCNEFLFAGFLPSKKSARRDKLLLLGETARTILFYEAPHRIEAALEDMLAIFGDCEVFVAREITKLHEEYLFGRLSEVRTRVKPIGEFVVVVSTENRGTPQALKPWTLESLEGLSRKEILQLVANTLGISRNQLYDLLFKK